MVPTSSESPLSAYRSVGDPTGKAPTTPGGAFQERLHPVYVFVWAASLARVAGAAYTREVFGAEATLALMTVAVITWYAIAIRARRRGN